MSKAAEEKATETKVEPTPKEWVLRHCKQKGDPGLYALELVVEDTHITTTTWNWDHKAGYHADISMFDLTVSDIMALGKAIIEEAIKIGMAGAK